VEKNETESTWSGEPTCISYRTDRAEPYCNALVVMLCKTRPVCPFYCNKQMRDKEREAIRKWKKDRGGI